MESVNIISNPSPRNLKFIIVVLAYLIFIIAARSGTGDDTYWHIKVGEWIVKHKEVPSTGIFSYAAATFPWVSHEWLAALFMYAGFSLAGWPALIFLETLSIALAMMLLFKFLLKRISVNASMIYLLLAYLLLIPHIMPRPHIFILPIIVYWTIQLIEAADSRRAPPLPLALLMTLWVNMHGSFIIGLAFTIFFAAETLFLTEQSDHRLRLAKNWLSFFALSVLACSLTPHGIEGLLLPLKLTGQKYMVDTISEWASPNFHGFQPLEVWLMLFIGLSLFKGLKLPVFRLVFVLGILHLSLKSVRFSTDLLSFLSPLVIAEPFGKQLKTPPNFSFSSLYPKNFKHWIIIACYLAAMLTYLSFRTIESEQSIQTRKILSALKSERQNLGNVLNSYSLSVYLIHEGLPVYIDSRAEIYGDKFLKDYFDTVNLRKGAEAFDEKVKKYNITWTIYETKLAINSFLERSPGWRKIYSDRYVTIFLKDTRKIGDDTQAELARIKSSLPELQDGELERLF
jgi:hypothetical protein